MLRIGLTWLGEEAALMSGLLPEVEPGRLRVMRASSRRAWLSLLLWAVSETNQLGVATPERRRIHREEEQRGPRRQLLQTVEFSMVRALTCLLG